MTNFEFTIIASGLDPQADDFEDRFYNAGCDDALVSFQKGHIIVDFDREAETIDDAIATAVACVVKAGAQVSRIEPDPLVSLAEIAARSNLSRAALTHYSKGQRGSGDFPAPVARVTSASPLWNWAHVSLWLYTNRKLSLDDAVQAAVVAEANKAVSAGELRLSGRLKKRRQDLQKVA